MPVSGLSGHALSPRMKACLFAHGLEDEEYQHGEAETAAKHPDQKGLASGSDEGSEEECSHAPVSHSASAPDASVSVRAATDFPAAMGTRGSSDVLHLPHRTGGCGNSALRPATRRPFQKQFRNRHLRDFRSLSKCPAMAHAKDAKGAKSL